MIDEVKRETLRAGVVDWVSIGEVYSLVAMRAPSMTETELKSTTFDAVQTLLHQGLMEIGDISHSGFQAWGGTLDSRLDRVSTFMGRGTDKEWGDDAWLCNTVGGDEIVGSD